MMMGLGVAEWDDEQQAYIDRDYSNTGYGGSISPYVAPPVVTRPAGTNYSGVWDTVLRGAFNLVGSQVQKPTYRTVSSPSGSMTEIYSGGGQQNYPGGGAGPTSLPTGGVSVTTMLLLGAAAMMMLVLAKR